MELDKVVIDVIHEYIQHDKKYNESPEIKRGTFCNILYAHNTLSKGFRVKLGMEKDITFWNDLSFLIKLKIANCILSLEWIDVLISEHKHDEYRAGLLNETKQKLQNSGKTSLIETQKYILETDTFIEITEEIYHYFENIFNKKDILFQTCTIDVLQRCKEEIFGDSSCYNSKKLHQLVLVYRTEEFKIEGIKIIENIDNLLSQSLDNIRVRTSILVALQNLGEKYNRVKEIDILKHNLDIFRKVRNVISDTEQDKNNNIYNFICFPNGEVSLSDLFTFTGLKEDLANFKSFLIDKNTIFQLNDSSWLHRFYKFAKDGNKSVKNKDLDEYADGVAYQSLIEKMKSEICLFKDQFLEGDTLLLNHISEFAVKIQSQVSILTNEYHAILPISNELLDIYENYEYLNQSFVSLCINEQIFSSLIGPILPSRDNETKIFELFCNVMSGCNIDLSILPPYEEYLFDNKDYKYDGTAESIDRILFAKHKILTKLVEKTLSIYDAQLVDEARKYNTLMKTIYESDYASKFSDGVIFFASRAVRIIDRILNKVNSKRNSYDEVVSLGNHSLQELKAFRSIFFHELPLYELVAANENSLAGHIRIAASMVNLEKKISIFLDVSSRLTIVDP